MGNSEANEQTPRLYKTPSKHFRDPISSMQSKVLMSKEQLLQEHYSTSNSNHKTMASSPSPWSEHYSELYNQLLTQRSIGKEPYEKTGERLETTRECMSKENKLEVTSNSKYVIPRANDEEKKERHRRYGSHVRHKPKPKIGSKSSQHTLPVNPSNEEIKNRNSIEKEGFRVDEVIEDVRRRLILSNAGSIYRPTDMSSALARPMKPPSFDRISLLPPSILFKILSYGIDGFRVYLCVNPSWYCGITEAFNEQFNGVENKFVNMYVGYLSYKDSYTNSSLMKFCDTLGTRIDRVIRCESLSTTKGKTVTISYTYKYVNEPSHTYKATFKYDSVRTPHRTVWAYLNECKFHGEEMTRAHTPDIMPICVGDNLEIAVNYYSMRGLVDLESIVWQPIVLETTPKADYTPEEARGREPDTSRKVFVDVERVCELEDSERWRDLRYEKKLLRIENVEQMRKNFDVRDVEFSDLDITALKITLIAAREGNIGYNTFGVPVRIVKKNGECTNEAKRSGLVIDRHAELQLRVGDCFIFYYAKSNIRQGT